MSSLDGAIEIVVRESVERLIHGMVCAKLDQVYTTSDLSRFVVSQAEQLFRTEPELRERLKRVLCDWIDKGCPPPQRR